LPEAVQRPEFVCEQDSGLAGVCDWVIYALAHQLVVLYQPMIRILRETDGRQHQGVDYRQAVDREIGCPFLQNRKVVEDQVVAKHAIGVLGQAIKVFNNPFEGTPPGTREGQAAEEGAKLKNLSLMRNLEIKQQGAF